MGSVVAAVFAPANLQYAFSGLDSTTTLVDYTRMQTVRANPAARACERAGGPLAPDMWTFLAPGIDYTDTCTDS